MEGLNAVDKAQEWYLKQISTVQDKIKHLGRMGSHVVISSFELNEFSNSSKSKKHNFRSNGQKPTKNDSIFNALVLWK